MHFIVGDEVKNAIINNNQKSVFKSVEKEYLEMATTLDKVAKVLNNANDRTFSYGFFDYCKKQCRSVERTN